MKHSLVCSILLIFVSFDYVAPSTTTIEKGRTQEIRSRWKVLPSYVNEFMLNLLYSKE